MARLINRQERNALAAKFTAAQEQARRAADERHRSPIFLALHVSQPAINGVLTYEVTGRNIPRMPMRRGYRGAEGAYTPSSLVFDPWPHAYPIVVTHFSLWDAREGGNLLPGTETIIPFNRPIVLMHNDALVLPPGTGICIGP